MKQSNLKLKKDQKNTKSKNKLVIKEEPNSKFKNEVFQKLFERNYASNYRLHTENPSLKKDYPTQRSASNLKGKRNKIYHTKRNSQIKDILDSAIKIKRFLKAPDKFKRHQDYPNLIGGVLHQVNYYNTNNNNNYNENVRYKPIDSIFNEPSFISNRKDKENNNNNSPNISFNSENQNEQKSVNENRNNIRKVKFEEDDNNDNTNDNIYNNYNIENEMKVNADSLKNRKNDIIDNGKSISPIISATNNNENRIKKGKNDIIGQYVNNTYKNENTNDYNNNKLKKDKKDNKKLYENNLNIRNKNNDKNISQKNFKVKQIEKEEEAKVPEDKKIKENKLKKDLLSIESNNNIMINNFKNYINKLEKISTNKFSFCNPEKENKLANFNCLEEIKNDNINYIGKKLLNKENETNNKYESDDKRLKFNNDDEVLNYIKKKLKEDKDEEYGQNKLKYNYFILTKKFKGRILYEIGLENDLKSINSVLEKENVEIEHKKVVFIPKIELENLKNNKQEIKQEIVVSNDNTDEAVEKLKKENEKLKKKIDLINNNYEERNSNLVNDYNKLTEDIERLNENNKEIEKQLKDKQNIIKEYENKIKEYDKLIESYNTLQKEREKFVTYINELQEYDQKVVSEYQKMKQQLEIEKQKNNLNNNNDNNKNAQKKYFTIDELEINSNVLFNIINKSINKKGINEKKEINLEGNEILKDNNFVKKDEYVDEENNIKKKNKVTFVDKEDSGTKNEKKKRDDSANKIIQRINQGRKRASQLSEENNKLRKSEKIKGIAGELEDRLKNNEGKLFVDLEYEKNKMEEEEENNDY